VQGVGQQLFQRAGGFNPPGFATAAFGGIQALTDPNTRQALSQQIAQNVQGLCGVAQPQIAPGKPKPALATGLENPKVVNRLAADMVQLQQDWPKLTPQQRQAELTAMANRGLSSVGVFGLEVVNATQLSPSTRVGYQGGFDQENWRIDVNAPINSNQLSVDAARDILSTLYHEIRHTEQYFRIAQSLASYPPSGGSPRTAEQIAVEMRIPISAAQRAVQAVQENPLTSTQRQRANVWYQSIYGTGSPNRERIFRELDTAQRGTEKYRRLKAEYLALPEEKDAFDLQPLVEISYDRQQKAR
jgi:hypothetical protein